MQLVSQQNTKPECQRHVSRHHQSQASDEAKDAASLAGLSSIDLRNEMEARRRHSMERRSLLSPTDSCRIPEDS